VLIALDSRIIGIFDGATTNNKFNIFGQSSGKFAASTVANLAISYRELLDKGIIFDPNQAIKYISCGLNRVYLDNKIDAPYPATTGGIVFIEENVSHFLVVGDTGIRINNNLILKNELIIDRIWLILRKYVYDWYLSEYIYPQCLSNSHILNLFRKCEIASREFIYNGLECAECELRDYVENKINIDTILRVDGLSSEQMFNIMLRGVSGIQFLFANSSDKNFGYAIFNGNPISGAVKCLSLPNKDIKYIEVFSDGYLAHPLNLDGRPTIQDWENLYNSIEKIDPFHLNEWPYLKCGFNEEFFDDRSLIIAEYK
jgi:hypothetical protein